MSRESKVRSSKLKTGLSSSEDRGALEVTSPSTPHKSWDIHCFLREKDEKRIRDGFQFPSSIKIRIPNVDNRACHFYTDKRCFLRLTSLVDFVSPSILSLESFSSFCNLLQPT